MRRPRGRGATLAVLAALTVAGCAEAEKPVALPKAESSASTTPAASPTSAAPSPSATRSPGEFDEATKRSAEQFVRDYWEAVNRLLAGQRRDAEVLRRFHSPACLVCEDIYKDVKRVVDRRQRQKGGEQRVLKAQFDTNNGRVALVETVIQSMPGQLLDNNGQVVQNYSGGKPLRSVFNLVRTKEGWIIQDVLRLSQS